MTGPSHEVPTRRIRRCHLLHLLVLLVACTRPGPEIVPSPTSQQVTPAPSPTTLSEPPVTEQRLVICTLEPRAAGPFVSTPANDDLLALFYEPPIERVAYGWEARLVERVPTLENGDVITRPMPVSEGTRYVDALGYVRHYTGMAEIQLPQLVVTFTLKPDLLWSDDHPLTSKDVLLGYHLAQLPEAEGVWRDLAERTARLLALDDLRLRWEGVPGYLDAGYPGFLFPPQPAHRWQGQTLAHILSDRTPPATGAYRIVAWEAGREIRFVPNRNYSGETPQLDEVIVRFPQIALETWHTLIADGTCDLIPPYPIALTSWQQWAQLGSAGQVTLWADVASTMLRLDFNTDPVAHPSGDTIRPLQDPAVRQALAGCISRKQLAQTLPAEAIAEAIGFVPPNHPAYDATDRVTYNPQASKRALDEIGWQDLDQDGTKEAYDVPGISDGEPLSLTLHFASQYFVVAAHIADDLETCGVNVDLQPTDGQQLYTPGPVSPLFGRWFDLALLGWQADIPAICGVWLSRRIPNEAGGWTGENFSGYTSATYDAACERALTSIDPAEQSAALNAAQQELDRSLPSLVLAWRPYWFAARPEVQGLRPDASALGTLWNIEEISIAERTAIP